MANSIQDHLASAIKSLNLATDTAGEDLKKASKEDIAKAMKQVRHIKKDDPMLQATIIWAMMHGLSNLLIDGHLHIQDNLDALYDLSFNTMINGMKS